MNISFDRKQLTDGSPNDAILDCRVQLDCSVAEVFMLCNGVGDTNGERADAGVKREYGVSLSGGKMRTFRWKHYTLYNNLDEFLKSLGYIV